MVPLKDLKMACLLIHLMVSCKDVTAHENIGSLINVMLLGREYGYVLRSFDRVVDSELNIPKVDPVI